MSFPYFQKKPIIYVIGICWNEAPILPYFLDYYSFADKIIIFDNMSSDNSVEILKKAPNVEVAYYNTDEKIRDDIYLEIKNNLWKSYKEQCDWIIILDIDEFIYHPLGIQNYLASLPPNIAILRCKGYEMFSFNFLDMPGNSISEKCNIGSPAELLSKYSIINPKLVEQINYLCGCHRANPVVHGKIVEDQIKLLHYKFVYPIQFLIYRYKIMSSRLSKENKVNGWGFHYSNIQNLIKKYNNLAKISKPLF